jgi:hypothetical protein
MSLYCAQRKVQVVHGESFRVDEGWSVKLAGLGISEDSDWTAVVGDELVSRSPSARCYRCDLADSGSVYFKRYLYPRKKWHEFWMRPAKPGVELWAYSRLKELNIPTLEVVAFAERRRLGIMLAGCIVTKGIPDTLDLEDFARNVWCHWPRARRLKVARALARVLLAQARHAHRNGFFHHDLKWRNILVKRTGEPDSLVWIDAPRASRMRFRERRGVITDLSGLARIAISLFSRFELMRFLHMYLGEGDSSVEAKRLFRQVQRHLSRRMPRPFDLPYPD